MKHSLPPVVDEHSRIVILGTLPGDQSLRQEQYYADPRNQFWSLLIGVFGIRWGRPIRIGSRSSRIVGSRSGMSSRVPSEQAVRTRQSRNRSQTGSKTSSPGTRSYDESHSTAPRRKPYGELMYGRATACRTSPSPLRRFHHRAGHRAGMWSRSMRRSFGGVSSWARRSRPDGGLLRAGFE